MSAKFQNAGAPHVEFSLNERDAELVGLFQRKKSIGELTGSLTFAQISDCDARVTVLNFHSGCRERNATGNLSAFVVIPCADLTTVNAAAGCSVFKEPRYCFADVLWCSW